MRAVLLEGRRQPPLQVDDRLRRIFQFGHDWEPRLLDEYARREGLEMVEDETPIEELRPGQMTKHDLAMYTAGNVAHVSLDGVQRNWDGTVTTVEVKTGRADHVDGLLDGRFGAGYVAQAQVERLITGASGTRILYGPRPDGFESMGVEETAATTLGHMQVRDITGTDLDRVRLHDGTPLADLDRDGLLDRVRAVYETDPDTHGPEPQDEKNW